MGMADLIIYMIDASRKYHRDIFDYLKYQKIN